MNQPGPGYPYPPDNQTPTQSGRFPTAVLGFLAAVLLVVVGVGVYFGVRALTGGDKGEPFVLAGTGAQLPVSAWMRLFSDSPWRIRSSRMGPGFHTSGGAQRGRTGPGRCRRWTATRPSPG